jgi:hypothetical protein
MVAIDLEEITRSQMRAAIAKAEQSRDMGPVWELLTPQLAQTPHPQHEYVLAMVLFKLTMEAAAAGHHADERLFLRTMRENCNLDAVDHAVISNLLRKAAQQGGWLTAPAYDDLLQRVERLPHDHIMRILSATVRRGQPADSEPEPVVGLHAVTP